MRGPTPPPASRQARPLDTHDRGPNLPVLLVVSYLPLARALLQGLQEEGIVTHLATTDAEADARLRTTRYAAIVVAWNIPREGGPALVRSWRNDGLAIPILMLIPSVNGSTLFRAVEAGVDDFLPLPFPFTDLLARLQAQIEEPGNAPVRT
ncbi:MAG: response regulator [Gemmataceae bacterium]|nr:response regulator [Gemmataceae bacterium]